jgi:hypothetical protein
VGQLTAANGEAAMSGDGWFHHRHAVGNDSYLREAAGWNRREPDIAGRHNRLQLREALSRFEGVHGLVRLLCLLTIQP